jgi:hypothetical protein
MAQRYDILTVRRDREGNARFTKIGAMFPSREGEGFAIKLDALPLPDEKGDVWLQVRVPLPPRDSADSGSQDRRPPPRDERREAPRGDFGRSPPPRSRAADLDDEIPF